MLVTMNDFEIHPSEMAAKLTMAINASGFTKAEIARQLHTTPQAVNGWTKKGKISKSNLIALASLLGRTVESIVLDNSVMSGPHNIKEPNTVYMLFDDEEIEKIKTIADYEGMTLDECINFLVKKGLTKFIETKKKAG